MKKPAKLLSLLLAACMLFASRVQATEPKLQGEKPSENDVVIPSSGTSAEQLSNHLKPAPQKGSYNEGVALLKLEDGVNDAVLFEVASISPLYEGSDWYLATLKDGTDTAEEVERLSTLDFIDGVDYDYVMSVTADMASVDVSGNTYYGKQKHHHTHKVPDGWKYADENGKHPGGSSDVVIAVIDTGVDYNHIDLRNNIWINSAEIPDNGNDDDGNGYIDDVYGWDCVGNDNDPMDDYGHGTHVAGIIAAENNEIGVVGIAYNCKIMVIKAGNSSGRFNNSDIAEAIQYAYMNGADIINMSFGSSSISVAIEDALKDAYNSCILVAATGNKGRCNQPGCLEHLDAAPMYPAAFPYVIGVMSTNCDGSAVSSFSDYDHNPYNSVEYEVYAVGEAVPSTWPGNKYADINGTSMAAPMVSAIAALLRSYYSDREVYSTKFIQSQIVNTGTANPYNDITKITDCAHSVVNTYEALTQLPKPSVNLYDYFIDDSTSINANNNGNGVIDAGETVRLYISLHNRGGVASNVNVSIDTNRGEGLTDPYFTFVNNTITLSDIGTYSLRESGDKYFEIIVSEDCPNNYLVDFNIRYTYENGMDEKDETVYEDDGTAQFKIIHALPTIKFTSASLTLADNIAVNFKVDPSQFAGYDLDDIYVVFNFNGEQYVVSEHVVDRGLYMFTFDKVAPRMISDVITASLYVIYNGETVECNTIDYSVKTYVDYYLVNTTDAKFRTLLVDLLNYGAQAQIYASYKTDALVNADLTDEQKSWATATAPTIGTVLNATYETIESPTVTYKSAALYLQDAVQIAIKLAADSTEGLTVKFTTDTNPEGRIIEADEFVKTTGGYYVYFDGLMARQMRETVYVTVYRDGNVVSNTLRYSIESYVYQSADSTYKNLPALLEAMMKYGDSAYNYFVKN